MSRALGVLALYALVVCGVIVLFASLYVPLLATPTGLVSLVVVTLATFFLVVFAAAGWFLLLGDPEADPEDAAFRRRRLLLVPLAMAIVAGLPAVLVPENALVVDRAFGGVSPSVVEMGISTLALAVVVAIPLPLWVRHGAWQRVNAVTQARPRPGDAPGGESSIPAVGRTVDVAVPDRLEIARLDAEAPAVYLFDDGRRAVVGFTTGAFDALSPRERDALLAREVARVVERAAVPQFWASALAHDVDHVLEPVTTQSYDSRADGTVRLPYWVVGPLKTVTVLVVLFLYVALHVWALASSLPIDPLALAAAYAIGALVLGFGLRRAATRVAHWTATKRVVAADERGALLADDATTLLSALRTLDEADRQGDGPGDDSGALDLLADCPTDRIPLDDRIDALDALDDTLDARTEPARRESTTANTSS